MTKVVLLLNFEGGEIQQKAMGKVSKIKGVKSMAIGKDKKMTVIGDMDPVLVDKELKKLCYAKILHVGSAEAEAMNNGEGEANGVQQAAAVTATETVANVISPQPPPQPDNPYSFHDYNYQNLRFPPSAPPQPDNLYSIYDYYYQNLHFPPSAPPQPRE